MSFIGVLFVVCAIFMLMDASCIVYFIQQKVWNYLCWSLIIFMMILFVVSMLDAISRGAI